MRNNLSDNSNNFLRHIFSTNGLWVFLPLLFAIGATLLVFDYTHERVEGFAEREMMILSVGSIKITWNHFLNSNIHYVISRVVTLLTSIVFIYRAFRSNFALDKVLCALSVVFCIHSFLFDIHSATYAILGVIAIWALIWLKKIKSEISLHRPIKAVGFSTALTYVISFIIHRGFLKPLMLTDDMLTLEALLRPSLGHVTETTAHFGFLLLSIICFQLDKKEEKEEAANLLGKGRSANVFKLTIDDKPVARKLFTGTDLTNAILTFFYGAPVDYQWNTSAINAAFYRRKVLRGLLKYWFKNDLTIADAYTTGIDSENNMQYLDTEFIAGRPATLHTPFHEEQDDEYIELKKKILPALQDKLKESGMIGTVWQAGYGQPCAIANFLHRLDPKENESKWVWIDAESGVPAIVCINPFKLFGYYIPMAIKCRKVMFDDLDTTDFTHYLEQNASELQSALGDEYQTFIEHCTKLVDNAGKWQSENRLSRGLQYFRFKGALNDKQVTYYKSHRIKWLGVLAKDFFKGQFPQILTHLSTKVCEYGKKLNPFRYLLFTWKSVTSRTYRISTSKELVQDKIDKWTTMGRLSDDEGQILKDELENTESQQYLSDFGVFLLFKPLGYLIRLSLPFWIALGVMSELQAAFVFAFISIILRTTYSLYRLIEDVLRGHGCPWIALVISPLPMIGTLAHPCQMVHTAIKGHRISQFIIYEILSTIAKKVPIYGGYNAELEYALNAVAFKLVRMSL